MTDENTLADLRALVQDFVHARRWEQFHNPKNLSMSIAIEAAELMECFQWATLDDVQQDLDENGARPAAVDELADVLIYCLALANAMQIPDLAAAVQDKLERSGSKYPADEYRGRYRKD